MIEVGRFHHCQCHSSRFIVIVSNRHICLAGCPLSGHDSDEDLRESVQRDWQSHHWYFEYLGPVVSRFTMGSCHKIRLIIRSIKSKIGQIVHLDTKND